MAFLLLFYMSKGKIDGYLRNSNLLFDLMIWSPTELALANQDSSRLFEDLLSRYLIPPAYPLIPTSFL
jgi:hypothetical protein